MMLGCQEDDLSSNLMKSLIVNDDQNDQSSSNEYIHSHQTPMKNRKILDKIYLKKTQFKIKNQMVEQTNQAIESPKQLI